MDALKQAIDTAMAQQYPEGAPVPPVLNKVVKESEKDRWTNALDQQLRAAGFTIEKPGQARLTGPTIINSEYRFHPERMWRFDRAIIALKIAIEVDGGGFGRVVVCHRCKEQVKRPLKDGRWVPVREGGRHNTGAGQEADHEKMNAAVVLGWKVLRFGPTHIKDGYAAGTIAQLVRREIALKRQATPPA